MTPVGANNLAQKTAKIIENFGLNQKGKKLSKILAGICWQSHTQALPSTFELGGVRLLYNRIPLQVSQKNSQLVVYTNCLNFLLFCQKIFFY